VLTRSRSEQLAVHPLLVTFPLGMLGASVLFDLAALAFGEPIFADVARWDAGIGVIAATITGACALVDAAATPRRAREARLARVRVLVHGGSLLLFGAALLLHARASMPSAPSVLLAAIGLALAALSASLGGRLAAPA